MDLDITNLLENEDRNYDQFINNINSELKMSYSKSEILENTEWIEEILFTIPYLVKAFENANKNLVTEEEVIKMELIKKVSVDSIKHLSKHTNFVTKFDEQTGDVIPEKLLNSNKEESYVTYENRFLYSLALLIQDFITVRERNSKAKVASKGKNQQGAIYEASTRFRKEKIKLKFEYSSEVIEGENDDYDIKNKIDKILEELRKVKSTEIYKELSSKDVTLVKSPLKMTNVLLKNVNYQYAVKLWNYLNNNFDLKNTAVQSKKQQLDEGITKKMINEDFLVKYLIFNRVNIKTNKRVQRDTQLSSEEINEATDGLIQKILELNPSLAEDELSKMIVKKYIQYKKVYEISMKPIENIFEREIDGYIKDISKNELKKRKKIKAI